MILAIVGKLASGKSEAADYICKNYNAEKFKFSGVLRNISDELYLQENRENLSKISQCLREYFGNDILAKVIAKKTEESSAKIKIAEGVRREEDIRYLQNRQDFYLIAIEAKQKMRFERLKKRGENEDDLNKTFEQFKQDENNPSDKTIPNMIKKADKTIKNNGTLSEFHRKLDTLIDKLNGS